MSDVITSPEKQNTLPDGGELLRDASIKIGNETNITKKKFEKVFLLGKIFPFFLEPSDFGTLVKELAYYRHPEEYRDDEGKSLLDRVANDTAEPESELVQKKAA